MFYKWKDQFLEGKRKGLEGKDPYKSLMKENEELKAIIGEITIADGITDLDEEVMKIYPGSDFQLCTIHYIRGLKSKVKEKDLEIIEDANITGSLSTVSLLR